MKCPHCKHNMYPQTSNAPLGSDADGSWMLYQHRCAGCNHYSFILHLRPLRRSSITPLSERTYLVWPKGIARDPVPSEVPAVLADDYIEACLVLADSPKASAALSRRCLQYLLREQAEIKDKKGANVRIKKGNLGDEIKQVLDDGHLPTHLANELDAIRNIGNFAAHPTKDTNTGEIVDVAPGEADWNLEVLEFLFDHYFVKPAVTKKKKGDLNKKLKAAGKPEMK
jgi:hypothetical protein